MEREALEEDFQLTKDLYSQKAAKAAREKLKENVLPGITVETCEHIFRPLLLLL